MVNREKIHEKSKQNNIYDWVTKIFAEFQVCKIIHEKVSKKAGEIIFVFKLLGFLRNFKFAK